MIRKLTILAAFFAASWSIVAAQAPGVHPVSGRRFAEVMDASGAAWLDRRERDVEEAPDDAIAIIGVKKGSTVADIGAGSGYWTVKLSKRVGPSGVVYATDIQPAMIAQMSVAEAKLELEAEGFKLSRTNDELSWQHVLFFTKK